MSLARTDLDTPAPAGFASGDAHLAAEIGWVADLVRLAILENRAARRDPVAPVDEFSGMFVSEGDIDRFLNGPAARSEDSPRDPVVEARRARLVEARAGIDAGCARARANGAPSRLDLVVQRFGLSPEDCTILLCSLAPEFDPALQRALGYLQDEATRRRPSVALLAQFAGLGDVPAGLWRHLGPEAPLFDHRLLVLPPETEGRPRAAREPRVAEPVLAFVTGSDCLDPSLAGLARLAPARAESGTTAFAQTRIDLARKLAARLSRTPHPAYIWGPVGAAPARLAEATAHAMERPCLWLTFSDAMTPDARTAMRRDARLHGAAVLLEAPEATGEAKSQVPLRPLLNDLADLPVILTGSAPPSSLAPYLRGPLDDIPLTLPDIDSRAALWAEALPRPLAPLAPVLASKFRFGPAQIADAVTASEVGADTTPQTAEQALYAACRKASGHGLNQYAQSLRPKLDWDDLVLPPDSLGQLREICACVDHRQTVFGQWGFDRKFSLGKGLCVLFSGASGTGKTMSAEIIAHELGQEIYKIDLSAVVSKYIGETEQNLARIFDEAEESNAILFFDEADALFGRRSEVKDAHDRYANIEINYLLQKLDEYEGIVVLASNLKNNFDSAFMRRLNYVVEFPMPDATFRRQIWQRVFPDDTPLAPDLDIEFLAERFQLSGGNIKNIAINAAFMAAASGEPVRMRHVVLAVRREHQKLGKLCSKSDYGPYFRTLKLGALE